MISGIDIPKYQRLKQYIVNTIQSKELKPGDKISSENELADRFEISRQTVRQAIGDLVAEGWLYRVKGKGTFVDRRPDEKLNQSKTVGVITTYLNDYIFPAIIRGIDGVLSNKGYNIMIGCTYNQHQKERLCLENFGKQDIVGLIVEPTKSVLPNPNIDLYKELSSRGIPVLFIHSCYRDLNYSYIIEDDKKAGYLATKHLIELGHSKIGGIFKMDDIQGHYRFSGFQKACMEVGHSMPDSHVLWFETDDIDIKFQVNMSKRLADLLSECTAIVCYNEQVAVKVMDAARDLSLSIPDDISLVSFDDSQLAVASEVKLTTVAHPKEALGEKAGEAIISMIEREKNYFAEKMEPLLIIRNSTKSL